MEKIRVRHQGQRHIYIHNDLFGAAHHFLSQIHAKLAADDRKGIVFEYMACLVMLAFTFEAKVNFLGHKLIAGWKERQPFNEKVKDVLGHLEVAPDWTRRPYSSISALKDFRDSLAHGKPRETEFDMEIVAAPEKIDRKIDLRGEWEPFCEHENVFNTYEDVEAIWKELLSLSGLAVFETITHGNSGITLIETLEDGEP